MVNSQENEKFTTRIFQFLITSGIFGGVFGLITFVVGDFISIQNQNERLFSEYIREMSSFILEKRIHQQDAGWDDINISMLTELSSVSSDKILDDDLKLIKLPGLDFTNAEIKKLTEEVHEAKKIIARSVTLNTLRRLDDGEPIITNIFGRDLFNLNNNKKLKAHLIKFLYESKLLGYCHTIENNNKNEDLADTLENAKCKPSIIKLEQADLAEAKINEVKKFLNGINLSEAKLDGADFSGIDLSRSDFSNSSLVRTNFSDAVLDGIDFSNTCIANANFKDAKGLETARFSNTTANQFTKFPKDFDKNKVQYINKIVENNIQEIKDREKKLKEAKNKNFTRISDKC